MAAVSREQPQSPIGKSGLASQVGNRLVSKRLRRRLKRVATLSFCNHFPKEAASKPARMVSMRFCSLALGVVLALTQVPAGLAEVVEIEGKVKAVDASGRTISIDGKTLEVAKKCDVVIDGKPATLQDMPINEAAVLTYDDKFELVTSITVGQPTWLFCDLACKGNTPELNHKVISADEIVFLPNPQNGRALLVSSKKYGKCKLRFEFMYDSPAMLGNPFVAVAARAPNMKGKEFLERWPFGIEFKLWHGGFGRLVLPHPDFQAEMAYGQERQGRNVPPLKQQTPLRNGWNIVEIAVQGDSNVVVKGNGVTLNAIGNAENIDGHIVVFPPACEFRVRNMTVEVDGKQSSLSFASMGIIPCEPSQK